MQVAETWTHSKPMMGLVMAKSVADSATNFTVLHQHITVGAGCHHRLYHGLFARLTD